MRQSSIIRIKNDPIAILRKSYISLCGDKNSAYLLSYFEYWHNIKAEMTNQNKKRNDIAERYGDERKQDESLYHFHNRETIYKELLGTVSIKGIEKGIKHLVKLGFLSIHPNPNPRYSFDKTRFSLLHIDVVNLELSKLSKQLNASVQNDKNIESFNKRGAKCNY